MKAGGKVDPRKLELAKIHAGAAKLGLITKGDDSAYRDMLYAVTRQRSAADLDSHGRQLVLEHLQARGAPFQAPRAGRARYRKGTPAALIRWIWTCLARAGEVRDGSDEGLWSYCKAELARLGECEAQLPAALQFLDGESCSKLIEHLKRWASRSNVKWQ